MRFNIRNPFLRVMMIPDVQAKPGVPVDHLAWAGMYAARKQPEVIVCIGDFADMPSLSSYDKGKRSFEGRRYKNDIGATHCAMETLMAPIALANDYNPLLIMVPGNHEARIPRATNDSPELEGLISLDDLEYENFGWTVAEYLDPVLVNGVAFSHFFSSGQMGRPITTARSLLNKMHTGCVAGHQQGRDIAYSRTADGREITGIIAGSFYQHDEEYLNPLTNKHWRGIFMLHEVNNGTFDEMPVSMNYLRRKFK